MTPKPEWIPVFYENLQARMKSAGISERQLSERVGLSPAGLRKMRVTQVDPKLSVIIKIANELNVRIPDLIAAGNEASGVELSTRIAAMPEAQRRQALAILDAISSQDDAG